MTKTTKVSAVKAAENEAAIVDIAPTVGRIVWYYPAESDFIGCTLAPDEPMAATVAFVLDAGRVNLSVTDHRGCVFPVEDVELIQGVGPHQGEHCRWMPYQLAQAAK